MLYFLTLGQHGYTVRIFQNHTKAEYFQIMAYEDFDIERFNAEDVVVFCDIDRCKDAALDELKDMYSQIQEKGCRLLNDPSRVLRRYDLLQKLYKKQVNDFKIYRYHELPNQEAIRFPVFVRDELEHDGSSTALIYTYEALNEALSNPPPNALVCEFIDTTSNGHHHKYGAFVLDGIIIPRHFFLSDDWNVKSASGDIGRSQELEIDYVLENPHEEELLQIAEYANIEFGRIDYALTEKGIQVFEINTNPTVIDRKDITAGNPRHFITNRFIDIISKEFINLTRLKKHV